MKSDNGINPLPSAFTDRCTATFNCLLVCEMINDMSDDYDIILLDIASTQHEGVSSIVSLERARDFDEDVGMDQWDGLGKVRGQYSRTAHSNYLPISIWVLLSTDYVL